MHDSATECGIKFRSTNEERLVFFLVFVGVLSLTYSFLFALDFLPEKPITQSYTESEHLNGKGDEEFSPQDDIDADMVSDDVSGSESEVSSSDFDTLSEHEIYPQRIIFDALDGRTVTVLNPESRSVEELDSALQKGVVRHPDSADFERIGTIFLFGHSSYLPNVINKNFQAFNGIQNMTWGDRVRLESSSRAYVYRVDRVYEVSATDAEVEIESGRSKLTLVTCDSFGSKSDRFVVEATLVGEYELENKE